MIKRSNFPHKEVFIYCKGRWPAREEPGRFFSWHLHLLFVRFILKRKALFVLFIFGLTAMTWAQGWERGRNAPHHRQLPPAETVTISGNLTVAHGMPAIASGDTVYLVGRLSRLTGFIDGLREGAQVTIEGSAMTSRRNNNLKLLNPTRLTLDGRSHDLTSPARAFGFDRAFGARPHSAPRQFGAPCQTRRPGSRAHQTPPQRHGQRGFQR